MILNIKWQSLTSSNKHISIIEHIENNSNFYKKSIEKKLIDFSSNIYLKDKNLYQSFQYKNCYNQWQMSLINEKSFLKTPEIIVSPLRISNCDGLPCTVMGYFN